MCISQTILSQILAIDSRALFAWGAKDLTNMGDGLKFKTSGLTPWKGYVYIKYNHGNDLYDIEFFKSNQIKNGISGLEASVHSIFAENLVSVIDNYIG